MRARTVVLAATLFLTSCASSTGILPAGPDTYTMTERYAPVRGGSDAAQRDALEKANQFCSDKGRVFVPSTMGTAAGPPLAAPNGYTVTFKCLPTNDPAIAHYQLGPAPNVIVEQRNR